jgi:hypothetical protein
MTMAKKQKNGLKQKRAVKQKRKNRQSQESSLAVKSFQENTK